MEFDRESLKSLDSLAVANTLTITALVSVLVRRGLLSEQELTAEVRRIRERLGIPREGEAGGGVAGDEPAG